MNKFQPILILTVIAMLTITAFAKLFDSCSHADYGDLEAEILESNCIF
jgi:hypothetical protein